MFKYYSLDGCEIDRLGDRYIVLDPPDVQPAKLIAMGFFKTDEGIWGKYITQQEYYAMSGNWQSSALADEESDSHWEHIKNNMIYILLFIGLICGVLIAMR